MPPEAEPPEQPGKPAHPIRTALLFAAGAGLAALAAILLLSLDSPVTRVQDPTTQDAYVGGDTVALAARVQGYLVALPITDNQQVRAGDPIARIEGADYRARVEQAQAQLDAAIAQLGTLQGRQGQLTAQIGQAQTQQASQQSDTVRTTPELRRQERLIATDVGLRRSLEQAQADQRRTEAGVQAARANVAVRQKQAETLAAQVQEAEAAIPLRRAALALAEIDLAWTIVTAPADGTLGPRQVRVGDLLTPGTTIVSLTPLGTVWVDANFTERQLPGIHLGDPARLRLDAFPDQPLDGHVAGLAPLTGSQLAAAPADNATGNFTKVVQRVTVRIAIDWDTGPSSGPSLRGLVRPGMSVTAQILGTPTPGGPPLVPGPGR